MPEHDRTEEQEERLRSLAEQLDAASVRSPGEERLADIIRPESPTDRRVPLMFQGKQVGVMWSDFLGRIFLMMPDAETPVVFDTEHPVDVTWLKNWLFTRFAEVEPPSNMRTYAEGRHDAFEEMRRWARKQIH